MTVNFFSKYDYTGLKIALDPNWKGAVLMKLIGVLYENQLHLRNYTYKIIREPLYTVPTVFYFPKNFYLISAIDKHIEAMQTSGLIAHWTYGAFHSTRLLLNSKPDDEAKSLGLNYFTLAFQAYAIGCILSFVAFAAEIFRVKIEFKNLLLAKRRRVQRKVVKHRLTTRKVRK